jgi:antitoxin (DNA-binding transcriptional repressor) of toxin-antitoxin stability system
MRLAVAGGSCAWQRRRSWTDVRDGGRTVIEIDEHEAVPSLSPLLRQLAAGEDVVILSGGVPMARLVAIEASGRRLLGQDAGRYTVPSDFDAPLPGDELEAFGA